jgi:hypothetical protein
MEEVLQLKKGEESKICHQIDPFLRYCHIWR